jgi:CRP-like cAMP-binding protein
MTQNKNKQFNTYKEGLDLEFLREYCMEHGERRTFLRGETLEEAGEPAQWVAFVERGCFKYMVHNDEEGRSATKETLATKGTQEGLLHGLRLRGRIPLTIKY